MGTTAYQTAGACSGALCPGMLFLLRTGYGSQDVVEIHRFYREFLVLHVEESSIFQITMAPAKSRKIVVMGFRSVGNL